MFILANVINLVFHAINYWILKNAGNIPQLAISAAVNTLLGIGMFICKKLKRL